MTPSVAFAALVWLGGAAPLEDCVLTNTGGAARVQARCGVVDVPVDRASATSAVLRVGFGILPARSPAPAPDPVVYLAGGPGQASTSQAPLVARALAGLRQKRALVFFDARGTGRSAPIECADDRPLAARMKSAPLEEEALRAACLAQAPFEPRFITTEQIARDLEAVRVALGADQLNLVGGSYGTRLALTYDALFPGRVRAMVLDGVAPASMAIGDGMVTDNVRALEALDARCQAVPACAAAGRSLVEIVRAARARPSTAVALPHPLTGAPASVDVDGDAITTVVRLLLYAEEGGALLPPLLRAVDAGDLVPVAAQLLMAEKSADEVNPAMQMAVLCAEDVPFYKTALVRDGVFPDARDKLEALCAVWPHATVPASFHEPKTSSTPTLLLSGTNDPVTPPARAEEAKEHLKNSVHVVLKGLSHGVFFRGCMPGLVQAFVEEPVPAELDRGCAERMGPFPLFVDGMGP